MSLKEFCSDCEIKFYCKEYKLQCNAVKELAKICIEEDRQRKRELVIDLAHELELIDFEVSEELRILGEKIIARMPELYIIKEFDIKIGYVLSYEAKRDDGKSILADCRKVTSAYKAYLPYDFIITFYDPNVSHLSDNQKKIVMLHELKHVGVGPKGLKVIPHDIEDFKSLIVRYGLEWNGFDIEVPDILAGDEGDNNSEEKKKKHKEKAGRKRQRMET